MQKLGSDPDLDGARIQFLREVGKSDPQVALKNVPNLSEASRQEHFYQDILRDWSRRNQEAAVAWAVENSESLPENVLHAIVPGGQTSNVTSSAFMIETQKDGPQTVFSI